MAFLSRVLLAWLCLLPAAQAELRELRAARVSTTVAGVVEHGETSLPYHWDHQHHNRPGEAIFEVPFAMPEVSAHPYGVYFLRVGNTSEIWLNGILLSRHGDMQTARLADYAKVPQYMLIPAQLLQKDNLFRIIIHAEGGRRGGLSALTLGPEDEVRDIFDKAYRWRVTASMAVAVFSLMVGLMALLLWLTQSDRGQGGGFMRDGIYLSACVAELCWVVRLSDAALEHPPLAWPWWSAVQTMAYAGWICGAALFCHHVAGWHRHASMPWVRAGLWCLFLTAAPAAYWAQTSHQALYLTAWLGFATFLFIGYGLFYFWAAVRRPTMERVLMATVGLLNVLVGLRDWRAIRISDNLDEVSWIRFSSVLFGLALGYIVIMRFHAASGLARDLTANLAARVAQKEQELEQSYQRMEQLARDQERTAERTRILRDMHDGVGSHISVAIRQLQSGKASHDEVVRALRDSLDQLKLSIDALNLPPGDITALLANLRYRLEPRFLASDIELTWDVDLLEPVGWLDDDAVRQLQFMVFEALSNVLQHARASVLQIRAKQVGEGVQLRIVDNGCGFDAQTAHRKGLLSMKERAAAIGAALTITSEPGQTVVEIGLA